MSIIFETRQQLKEHIQQSNKRSLSIDIITNIWWYLLTVDKCTDQEVRQIFQGGMEKCKK